jgi:hypothetical protein
MGTLYHGLWSFSSALIPAYQQPGRIVTRGGAALEPRGITPWGFSMGQLFGSADDRPYGLGDDFDVAFWLRPAEADD